MKPMQVAAVAANVLVVAVLGVALAVRSQPSESRPAASDLPTGLTGVTWTGSLPILSVVFTDRSARIFDGCSNVLRELTINGDRLEIGKELGPTGVCSGTGLGSPPAVERFDKVVNSQHLSWQRSGDTLTLTNDGGESVQLHASGPALDVVGPRWVLEEYVDLREYSHEGDFADAYLRIDDGAVSGSDMCNEFSGSAVVADATITFTDMHTTERSCSDQPVAQVVDTVLNGTIKYAFRGDQLLLYGEHGGLLIYKPSS